MSRVGVVRTGVATVGEVPLAGFLVAIGRSLIVVRCGLVAVGRRLIGVCERLITIGARLLIAERI